MSLLFQRYSVSLAESLYLFIAHHKLRAEQLLAHRLVKPDNLLSCTGAGFYPDLQPLTALWHRFPPGLLEQAHSPALLLLLVGELGDYLYERINVVKLLVHGGKAHICNRVQLLKPRQHLVAYLAGSGLGLHSVGVGVLNVVHQLVDLLYAYRALLDGGLQALEQLVFIEGLKASVLLVDHQQRLFNHLIGGEALAAVGALASAALLSLAGA